MAISRSVILKINYVKCHEYLSLKTKKTGETKDRLKKQKTKKHLKENTNPCALNTYILKFPERNKPKVCILGTNGQ